MEAEFIPYEQALALKELGFDYEVEFYKDNSEDIFDMRTTNDAPCILYQQAFRWFREKYDCHHTIQRNKKYVGITYSSVVNYSIDEFDTYEEAELECLKKLIEIVKEN